jgi:hypothetical protein
MAVDYPADTLTDSKWWVKIATVSHTGKIKRGERGAWNYARRR